MKIEIFTCLFLKIKVKQRVYEFISKNLNILNFDSYLLIWMTPKVALARVDGGFGEGQSIIIY